MHRRALPFVLVALGFVATATPIAQSKRAQVATPAVPAGISVERLGRIDTLVQKYVDQQRLAGAVTLVVKKGTPVHFKAYGMADREQAAPMKTDTIFRIASMSKAVTSVAILMLVDNGDLLLSDPVSKFLPAFDKTTVAVTPDPHAAGGRLGTVPAKRRITIRDLLTHTAGISYGGGALEAEYKAAGFDQWYFASMKEPLGTVIDRLATLPFESQPGERYVYGYNTDILGRVVEVVSGLSLDEFFRRRIFEPLRMNDSHFFLPREKAARLATVYGMSASGTVERAPDRLRVGQGEYVDGPRACFSGGAGLLSTAHDYGRLLQMLLNRGELDRARILSPAAVAAMTSNQVGSLYLNGQVGFGLGFEVVEHVGRAGRLTAVGAYGWGSAYYSTYVVSPADDMVAIFFSQTIPATGLDVQDKFKSLAFQALEVPAR
jgi:CubicO group peptidase (beta-lactamase class C family)